MFASKSGFILPSLIITTTFIFLISLVVIDLIVGSYKLASREQYRINAQLAADAGVDLAITELNIDQDWSGTMGEKDIFNNSDNLRFTANVMVVDGSESRQKTVTSIGSVYSPASSGEPVFTRTVEVSLRGLSAGNFSVVTGVGGLYLSNSAKIVGGNVHVNGEVVMTNSSQIGLTSNPVTLNVAHYNCPSSGGASYPQKCTSGNPINISNPAQIFGDVCANNQTNGSRMSNRGLLEQGSDSVCPSEVAFRALPPHDRMQQITNWTNQGGNTLTSTAASCTTNGGSKTWPANVRITGDATISRSCQVTINGDAWIEGKLNMSNSAKLMVADSLSAPMVSSDSIPTIMVDGNQATFSNSSQIIANSSGAGPMIITYKSINDCTTRTDSSYCSELTGNDLYNSRNIVTIELDNLAKAPETVFFSKWSRVLINNSGEIGALVGQTVELKNSGAVTFGSVVPGDEGAAVFLVESYKRVY